jgi:hypothetical protein
MHLRRRPVVCVVSFQDRTRGCRVVKVQQVLIPEEGALHRSSPRRGWLRCASEVSNGRCSSERVIASSVIGPDVSQPNSSAGVAVRGHSRTRGIPVAAGVQRPGSRLCRRALGNRRYTLSPTRVQQRYRRTQLSGESASAVRRNDDEGACLSRSRPEGMGRRPGCRSRPTSS